MLVLLNDDADPQLITRVPQGNARREHALRDLIHDNPAILPVHDLDPSFGRLFTVAKELNIPGVGFVDVLLADERGRLVVVECKLWRNPQARREVVGQILDYARELSRYAYDDLQRQVSIATKRQGNVLYALAHSAGSDLDEASFVDRVSRDLAAGRFLLLIVGDGITEGTRRIGEYLQGQPGLAFGFGLIEMVEYRYGELGAERVIVQPRVLAQTVVIERHVIRSEVPGTVIDPVVSEHERPLRSTVSPGSGGGSSNAASEASQAWSRFVERFVAETRFDDPGQPPPRRGGNGWIRVPLPGRLYVNVYRSLASQAIGVQVRFPGAEGIDLYRELLADRDGLDAEFAAAALPAPEWIVGDVPELLLTCPSSSPWDEAREAEQMGWLSGAANQMVNSLRPRLQGSARELAA
ncbi:hypothetical protein [Sphingomonas bacterium]|uniref:hypothetical protein n=1 Tax=Sphingomonas bacterium TaxID=1895847 RepID=UPI001576D278|nr:hypothetical protein [Sphingomonas bacterium]